MIEGRRVLAVVPARGGSQGVKLKNLRLVGGVPLVGLAGDIARAVPEIDRAVCSTDHAEIARVAQEHGLAVPFLRPDDLSGPRIADWDVLNHALLACEVFDGVTYDIVLMLQPTSPSRTPENVRDTLRMLINGGFDAVWTVSETDSKAHPLKQLVIGPDGAMDYYDSRGATIIARQQLQPVYHRNGIAYAITRDCLIGQGSIKGRRCGALLIEGLVANIDTEFDLDVANLLAERRKSGADKP
ncbi:MAG: acylneuraminate cytidylyltransferase family protein [Hyphomicrobiales bacterium]